MVAAPAAADAVARARRLPRLRVGLHLVLVESYPCCRRKRFPLLVGGDGRFRADMARYGATSSSPPACAASSPRRSPPSCSVPRNRTHARPRQCAQALPPASDDRRRDHQTSRALRCAFRARTARTCRRIRCRGGAAARHGSEIVALFATMLAARLRRAGFRTPDQVFGLAVRA